MQKDSSCSSAQSLVAPALFFMCSASEATCLHAGLRYSFCSRSFLALCSFTVSSLKMVHQTTWCYFMPLTGVCMSSHLRKGIAIVSSSQHLHDQSCLHCGPLAAYKTKKLESWKSSIWLRFNVPLGWQLAGSLLCADAAPTLTPLLPNEDK